MTNNNDKTQSSEFIASASIVGGIGDIVFGLEGFREIKTGMCLNNNVYTVCYLCTHSDEGVSFVKTNPYVDKIRTIKFNHDLSHFTELKTRVRNDIGYLGDAKSFCYTKNPKIYLPESAIKKADTIVKSLHPNSKIVIIHPCGSQFSKYFLGSIRHVSTKEMSVDMWQSIIHEIWNIIYPHIILIGSEYDYPMLSAIKGNNKDISIYAGDLSITESMALIQKSHMVIGADSFAKSISLASKIPTVVLVSDHDDKFRDEVFLIPYSEDNYSCIIRCANSIPKSDVLSSIAFFVKDLWGTE